MTQFGEEYSRSQSAKAQGRNTLSCSAGNHRAPWLQVREGSRVQQVVKGLGSGFLLRAAGSLGRFRGGTSTHFLEARGLLQPSELCVCRGCCWRSLLGTPSSAQPQNSSTYHPFILQPQKASHL